MIYFDNAATTTVDEEILKSYDKLVRDVFANPASIHALGQKSNLLGQKSRELIASLFHAYEDEVIFTSGATESNNLAIKGAAFNYQNRGKHLITTKIEHPSVLNAFRQLENNFGFKVTYLSPNEDGEITLDSVKNAIQKDTILVSIMTVNNETGAINDIASIGKFLKQYPKIIFHSDATQAIGKIDMNYDNVDMLSLSAHKLHGFKGSGMLLKRKRVELLPLLSGGGQQNNIRSGTENFPINVMLAKTLRLAFERQKENYECCKKIYDYLVNNLKLIDGVKINSPKNGSPFILNFSTPKKASVVAEGLSEKEIYVSTKSACSSKKIASSYVLEAMGKTLNEASNSIRISITKENTINEAKIFIEELQKVLNSVR